jgi:hypothetical protein
MLERYPELLTSAALYIEMGSTRAVELGALLLGNVAFNEAGAEALAKMDIAVNRLVSLMVEGGDRAPWRWQISRASTNLRISCWRRSVPWKSSWVFRRAERLGGRGKLPAELLRTVLCTG